MTYVPKHPLSTGEPSRYSALVRTRVQRASVTIGLVPLFAATLGASALLLFWIQPLFTKMVLPLLGGSPSVWNTAMLFFQAALLAGYGYAHLSARWLGVRHQALLHLLVLALAFATLPIAVAADWTPPADRAPVFWLIGLFAVSLGLPFFALAATAPLLQRWFSHTGHVAAADPYFLYGASNLGSILALLSYPILLEPLIGADSQTKLWTIGFALLAGLIGLCALAVWRHAPWTWPSLRPPPAAIGISWRERLHWLALAFVPSSLLLGVTTHITTDLAAVPLLWILPLTLYLLTFVLVFARRPLLKHDWMIAAQPHALVLLVLFFWLKQGLWLVFPLHLIAFFVTAMVCHGELAKRRPATSHLTEFYLWLSLGGVLGGIFNALLAPVLFPSVYEYPLAVVLACLLRPILVSADSRSARWLDICLPLGLLGLVLLPLTDLGLSSSELGQAGLMVFLVVIGVIAFSFRHRPLRFGLGIAAGLAAGIVGDGFTNVIARERSFFGIHKVVSAGDGQYRVLMNGTTAHGAQAVGAEGRREPRTYYNRLGPLGQAMAAINGATSKFNEVGIVGLGTGSLACYRRPGQNWTFFEIDPVVDRLARDGRYFHYMADCAPAARTVLGDARLSLQGVANGRFDMLVVDAFSSDAIPLHLLTKEALALYLSKLSDKGVLVLHISNRHLELAPVVAKLAAFAGIVGRVQSYVPEPGDKKDLATASEWVVMARAIEALGTLADNERWIPLESRLGRALWTDDFSNIVGALKW